MSETTSRFSRSPIDVSSISRDATPTAKGGVLGYADGLDKMSAVEMLGDSRFLQDVKDFYYNRDGKQFSSDEEAVEYFWSDRTWKNVNTGSITKEALATGGYSDEQKRRLARIQTVFDANPDFWEDGGRGAEGFWQNAGALLLDPANLIGFGFGGLGAKAAARGAAIAGRTATMGELVTRGAIRGGVAEGLASGIVEGGADVATQSRDMDIGLRDEYSLGQTALATGIGAVSGGAIGGVLGGAAPLVGRGLSRATGIESLDVGAVGDAQGKAIRATNEAEAASRAAETGQPQDLDAMFDEYDVQLNKDMANELDQISTSQDGRALNLDEAIAVAYRQDITSPEQLAQALGVSPVSLSYRRIKRVFDLSKKRVAHQQMKNMPTATQNLRTQADRIETNPAAGKDGPDAANIDGNLEQAAALRGRATRMDAAYTRYRQFIESGKFREADKILQDPQLLEDMRQTGTSLVPVEGEAPPRDRGEGFTMSDTADEAALRQQRGDRGLPDPLIDPSRQIPEAPPGPRNVSGEGFDAVVDTSELPQSSAPRTAAESELTNAREMFESAEARRQDLNRQIKNLQQKSRRGTATEDEVAELANLGASRKSLNAEIRQAKKRLAEAESVVAKAAAEAMAPDNQNLGRDFAEDELESRIQEEADEILSEADAPQVEEDVPTLNDGAIETSKTEGDALDFLDKLGFDKKDMRRELRARTTGLTRRAAQAIRAEFVAEKLARLEAASHVQEAIDMMGGSDQPNIYITEGMRALIRSMDLSDTQRDLALDVYNDFVNTNAPSVFDYVIRELGEGRKLDEYFDFIRQEFGDDMVDILERQLRGDLDTLDRMATKIELPKLDDFTPAERDAINKVKDALLADGRTKGYSKPYMQMFLNQYVANLKEQKKRGINPFRDGAHEGRTIENSGKITVNGKTYEGYRVAGPQPFLKPATKGGKDNPNKYYGQLISSLKRDGVTLTGREAAFRAADEAKIEGATNTARKDPAKYSKKTVTDPETGKKQTVYTGYNAEKVRILDEARKELKKLDPTDDATEIRQVLVEDGIIPAVELNKAKYRPQQVRLGLGISLRQQYPKNVTGFRTLSNGRQTDGSVFVLRRAIPLDGKVLKRTSAGIIRLGEDVPRVGRGKIKVVDKGGIVEIDNHETVSGIKYERVLASAGEEKETASGFLEAGGGDEAFYDPVTERLYASREDVPANQEGSSVADLIADMNEQRKTLTMSTDLEIKAREVEEFRSSPRAQFEAGLREYRDASKRAQQLKDSKASPLVVQSADRHAKALRAELKKNYPDMWKDRKVIRKGVAQLKLAEGAGKVDDMQKEIADLSSETGEQISAEDQMVGQVIADKAGQQYADAQAVSKAYQDAFARFQEHGDGEKLQAELESIRNAVEQISHEKPATKPRVKNYPMVIKHNGVEVDLNNHFEFGKASDEDGGFDIKFLGKKIARVEKEEDGWLTVISDDLPKYPQYESMDLLKRGLVKEFDTRIRVAFKEGRLKASDTPEEVSFHEPNHQNTKTYKDAKQTEDLPDDNLEEQEFSGDDARLAQSAADYSGDVPSGREFSIGIKSGPFAGKTRTPSSDEKLVGSVLGKQSEQEFVLGHIEEGTTGIEADNSFVPFDEAEQFTAAKGLKKKTRKQKNELLDQDPDLIDPENKPVALNKTRLMEIDQNDLPEDLRGSVKTVFDLHDQITNLERLPWNSPEFQTKADYKRFTDNLRTLHQVMSQYAPHGIKLPNASRHASMRQLTAAMHERPVGEINAVMSVLRNLSEGDSRMPRFMQDPNGYSHRPANYANSAEANAISIGEELTPDKVPSFAKVIHEIGHWSYFNILSPEERMTFWDAMGKYIEDEGVNIALVRQKLPDLGGNELRSPQEFFAHQFTQFAISRKKAGEQMALMNLWKKVARKIKNILEAYFVNKAEPIDADLVTLFERILPDDDAGSNKFMEVARKFSEAGGRAGYASQKLATFEEIRLSIENAIDGGDSEAIKEALSGFVREAFAYSGKPGARTITNKKSGQKVSRVRLFDAKQVGETADGGKKHDFVNSHFVRINLVKRMYAIQDYFRGNPNRVLSEEDRLAEIDKLLATQESGDFNEINQASMTSTVMENAVFASEDADEALVMLANDVLGAINEAQVELRRQVARTAGKTDTGAGVKITAEGKQVATKDSAKGNQFRKRAQRRKKAQQENAEEMVNDTLSKLNKVISDSPSKMPSDAVDGATVPSPKGEGISSLIERYRGLKPNATEKRQLGQEIANRIAAIPELIPMDELPPRYRDSHKSPSLNEAIIFLRKMLQDGRLKDAYEMQSFIAHQYGSLDLPPQLRAINKAIDTETLQNNGLQTENGIPSDAPQSVKNALGLISHRDRRIEYTGRTLLYRALNLLGRTEKDLVNQTEFVTFEDLSKMINDYNVVGLGNWRTRNQMLDTLETAQGMYVGTDSAQNAESHVLNNLRKHFRKMGQSLAKENAPLRLVAATNRGMGIDAVPNADGVLMPQSRATDGGRTQAKTVMHEVGHMLIRTQFDEPKMKQIKRLFDDAVANNDEVALLVKRNYPEEALAEEFFVESLARYLTGRVSKVDAFGEVRLKSGLERIVDEMVEMIAYMFNGLMRNKTLRQEFRHLTMYGDMFRVRKRLQKPVSSAQSVSNNYSMPALLAPKYAQETVANLTEGQRIAAREFTGAREGEDLMDFVYYHGTPNGNAFNRSNNPDVILEPSGNDSLYGPGIYVTKSAGVATDYSKIGHRASLERMVNEATDNPARRAEGAELIGMITNVRERYNEMLREMDAIQYSKQTEERAKKVISGELDDLDVDDMGYQLATNQKRLASLLEEEELLYKALEKATGVKRKPATLPLFVRADDTFNMDANSFYVFGQAPNSVNWIVDEMARRGVMPADGALKTMQMLGTRPFSGEDFYEALVDGVRSIGISEADAKAEINGFFADLGYDSLRITEVNSTSDDMIEALVLFEPTQVKHVDAKSYDHEHPELYMSRLGKDNSFLGEMANHVMDTEEPLDLPQMRASILNAAEKMGAPKPVREFINKVSRGENLEADDLEGISRSYRGNFLGENSSFLRKNGANWLGNIVKPSNGAGIFHKHNADLAGKLHPVLTALRNVPDYGNRAKRFYEKSKGLAAPLLKSARTTSQPPSHDRIMRALRADDISTLNPAERQLAQQIADVFAQELIELRQHGYSVGDLMKTGKRFYLPQAWDTGMIRDNPRKFLNIMTDRFIKDRRAQGMPADRASAELAAKTMMNRMLDTDGRIDTDAVLNKKMQSDPFYQRMINLDPEELPEFEEFMVNDLEGLITRYFDKTTRKIILAKEFGVEGHGFHAYRAVAEGGNEAAIKVLQSDKVVRSVKREMEVVAEIEDVVIPPMKRSKQEMEAIIRHVRGMLDGGNTKNSLAQKQAAIDYLYNMGDLTSMDVAMRNNWRKRTEAVVNAMADFPIPPHDKLIKFMDSMYNVLNKRPVDGGDGTGLIDNASRKIRAFNAVTLLGWTTLTSLPDGALPLIRSGNFKAWVKGMKQAMQSDPSYRNAVRDIGVGVENLIHDRMTHMAGEGSQRFSNAFFNATLLTPWTNFMREAAAIVGFNALKAEAEIARKFAGQGVKNRRYMTAMRFLSRYGLEDYGDPNGPSLSDIRDHVKNDKVRYAIMRFVSETIFTPDPNDNPLWAQTPWGLMVYQLKSFPVMMQRMVFGEGGVMDEAFGKNPDGTRKGNFRPLIYLTTAGTAFGAGSLAIKDFAQARGGEDNRERALRDRASDQEILFELLESMGITDIDVADKKAVNQAIGWWLEGLMAVGGLGFLAELMYSSAQNLDNGMYGTMRIASGIFGPAVGNFNDAVNVAAGVQAAVTGDKNKGKQRHAARTIAGRIPVLGGSRDFREGAADMMGNPRSTRRSTKTGNRDPFADLRKDIYDD